jgi:3-deoxy-D-manno-octulosonate 8-phosphate phosphatase (KDO 8-P phosphatase)
MTNCKLLFKRIKAFVFDVDGVFTDGQVYLLSGQEFVRAVNIKDGYAVQHCIKMGYSVGIISGGKSDEIITRFRKLGVVDIYMGSSNKLESFEDFRVKHGYNYEETLYMGDDIPDYEIMERVGVPTCPKDAAIEIKQIAKYISDKKGGRGCVRDVIEQVLRVQDKWVGKESFQW